jgi:hypothetical protein
MRILHEHLQYMDAYIGSGRSVGARLVPHHREVVSKFPCCPRGAENPQGTCKLLAAKQHPSLESRRTLVSREGPPCWSTGSGGAARGRHGS